MYSALERSDSYKDRLLKLLKNEYGIEGVRITPAKRGFYGETWRLDTASSAFFLKLDYSPHQSVYEGSFPVIEHLCNNGVDFIGRIVKTADGRLSTRFNGAVLGMFDWIDGENIQTEASKIPEFQMLARVYTVPHWGIPIPREDFSGKGADMFFEQWSAAKDKRLLSLLEKNRVKLEHRSKRLKYFSGLCQGDKADFFITHGDAGGNFIAGGGKYFIVDWDEPVLAPPERDAWVMCCRDWARAAFHEALDRNGISHILRKEQLAYYCYQFFFYYLSSFLDAFRQTDEIQEIGEFINTWMAESMAYADSDFQ